MSLESCKESEYSWLSPMRYLLDQIEATVVACAGKGIGVSHYEVTVTRRKSHVVTKYLK